MAIRQLVDSDRVIWARNAHGEDVYRLRSPYPVAGVRNLEELSRSLITDLEPLVGLVRASDEGHEGVWSHAEWRWLPRCQLECFVEEIRAIRDRLIHEHNRNHERCSAEEHSASGHIPGRAYLLARVMPVHPKETRT